MGGLLLPKLVYTVHDAKHRLQDVITLAHGLTPSCGSITYPQQLALIMLMCPHAVFRFQYPITSPKWHDNERSTTFQACMHHLVNSHVRAYHMHVHVRHMSVRAQIDHCVHVRVQVCFVHAGCGHIQETAELQQLQFYYSSQCHTVGTM